MMDKIYRKDHKEIQGVNTTVFTRIFYHESEKAFRAFFDVRGRSREERLKGRHYHYCHCVEDFPHETVEDSQYITNITQRRDTDEPRLIRLSYLQHRLVIKVTEVTPKVITERLLRNFFRETQTTFGVTVTECSLEWITEPKEELTTSVEILLGMHNPIRIEE